MSQWEDKMNLVCFEALKYAESWKLDTYRKVGGRVLYTVRDLEDWSAVGERKSTRDKTAGTALTAASTSQKSHRTRVIDD